MPDQIDPKEIARAAAEGVANALKSHRFGTGSGAGKIEEAKLPPRKIICGLPAYLFEVSLTEHEGSYTVGEPTPTTREQ